MTSFDYQGSSVIRQFSISPVVGLSLSNFSRPVVYTQSENVPKLPLSSLVKKCDNAPKKYEQKWFFFYFKSLETLETYYDWI